MGERLYVQSPRHFSALALCSNNNNNSSQINRDNLYDANRHTIELESASRPITHQVCPHVGTRQASQPKIGTLQRFNCKRSGM